MSRTGELKGLLEEARVWVAESESHMILRNGTGWSEQAPLLARIDAALAEPAAVAEMAALYHVGLSERIRTGEAAPWVIEAIKLVERERDEARAEVAVLRQNIELNDASVALEKQLAEARAEIERLKGTLVDWYNEGFEAGKGEKAEWSADSFRRGAEAMREAAARSIQCPSIDISGWVLPSWAEKYMSGPCERCDRAKAIRALPIPEDKP